MDIKIRKRNGSLEPLCVEKTRKMVRFACEGLEGCNPMELELDSRIQFRNEMCTKDIQKILIRTAIEKVIQSKSDEFGNIEKKTNANWQYVAARLMLSDMYKEAAINRQYEGFGYGSYEKLIDKLTNMNLYGDYIKKSYSDNEIRELSEYIKPERDELFNYEGLKLLNDRYLIKGYDKEVLELPQERFMTIAMHLAIAENKGERVYYAKKFYDIMSTLKMTVATPTLGNAGTPFYQLSSCFISSVGDNLWSIYDVNQKFSKVSKHGGALGIYMGKVRGLNSEIRGHKNASGGVIPWIRLYNDTAVAVDQLGKRKGGASITLDIWHSDLYDFLELRTNNGDDRRKAHDIFPALSIPDLFMERLEMRENWSLFDPYMIEKVMGYRLEDFFDGDDRAFTERYIECEKCADLPRIEVSCLDIMKKIMKSAVETGTPFIFFRDSANRMNPNKHAGMVYGSNLCHEIVQNMSESQFISEEIKQVNGDTEIVSKIKSGDMVTCNLNSVNLGRIRFEELKDIIPLQIRMLDNVISLNALPVAEASVTSDKYRAIGLGTSGYHHYLANNKIMWESVEHLEEADRLYEEIAFNAIKASMELAKDRGAYEAFKSSEWESGKYFERRGYTSEKWQKLKEDVRKYGIRNGYIMAVAPTGSTSNIANTTAGIDPVFKKFFIEEKKGSFTPKTAPDLCNENFWFYKEAHHIDQSWSIEACAVRQRHVDQGQSFNLYVTPEVKAKDILKMYVDCWKKGIKTIYYVRNKSLEMDECTSCSS